MKNLNKLVFSILAIFMMITYAHAETFTVTNEEELNNALVSVSDGDVINIDSDINTKNMIAIEGSGKVTVNGNGHELTTTATKMFEIRSADEALDITFNNIIASNNVTKGRVLDTRNDNIILNVVNSTISASGSNSQPITIGGSETNGVTLNITDSSNTNSGEKGYAIITFVPVEINITESTITGWTTMYFKDGSEGSEVKVEDSILTSINNLNHLSNSFGAIAIEETGINIDINNSEITANAQKEAIQSLISVDLLEAGNNNITISNSEINIDASNLYIADYTDESIEHNITLKLEKGVKSNREIPAEYLPENHTTKNENDNYVVYEKHLIRLALVENAEVTINPEYAVVGEEVTLTITPKEGFELSKLIVTANDNTQIEVVDNKFVMPDDEVAVVVIYEPVQKIEISEVGEEDEIGITDAEKTEEILFESLESITDEELKEKLENTSINVKIEIEDVSVNDDTKKDFDEALKDVENSKIVSYFDITIALKDAVNQTKIGTLTDLSKPIELMVRIPQLDEVEEGFTRNYYIVREHDGKVEIIEDVTVSEDGKYLLFESSQFSTYALAYNDVANETDETPEPEPTPEITPEPEPTPEPENPDTSDNVYLYGALGFISIAAVAVLLYKLKKCPIE